jgi:hypothetical protein
MKYRFPRWISYALLGFIVFAIAAGLYAAGASTARSSIGVAIVYGAVGVCPMSLLVGGYLYVRRYSIQIVTEGVIITNAFRARTIPFPMIKQVVTATAPRSGTDTWLVDGNDAVIAKIDGGLVGFDMLLISLGKALQPYKVLFYRRESFGPWEMQVAGDSHWVPYEAPRLTRQSGRRLMYVMAFGCLLVAIAAALSWFADHGILVSH